MSSHSPSAPASPPPALAALPQQVYALARAEAAEWRDLDAEDPCTVPLYDSDETRLMLAPLRGGWHVDYFGDTYGSAFEATLECLCQQDVADAVTSLSFSGPDTGANGTRDWGFETLLASPVRFARLRALTIKPTAPEDHNISVINAHGRIMEEAGDIARWARKAPFLSALTVPVPPNADFFDVPLPHLAVFTVGGHFDTQHFIRHLAGAAHLPGLKLLDFTECTEQQLVWASQRRPGSVTPFDDYEALLASPVGERLRMLRLRNTCLDLAQLQQLQALRPRLQFMVIQAGTGGYVSYFARNVFPWRHLVPADPGQQDGLA